MIKGLGAKSPPQAPLRKLGLATTLLQDEESARHNRFLTCNFRRLSLASIKGIWNIESYMSTIRTTELYIPWSELSRGVSCRRRWPPPNTLALTTLFGY